MINRTAYPALVLLVHGEESHPKLRLGAVAKPLQGYVAQVIRTAADVDLSTFFDSVNNDLLVTPLGKKISGKQLLKLILLYLRTDCIGGGLICQ